METAASARGDEQFPLAMQVVRGMSGDGSEGIELLGTAFTRDQALFLSLLLELPNYYGISVLALDAQYGTPQEQTLRDLDAALKTFADGSQMTPFAPPRPVPTPWR
ncbi:hypothetical protein [Streptomyces sp. NPDC005828]|uniref:hypothetical protein n=1 Tax=Streptomyces sp. NPDC005828 TaxID=3157071 RepID=UPI0033D90191